MVRNKGGLSAIVATVLIVLITVAAVAIFWVAILPVIQENILFVGEEARLSIIVDKGYTAFDADKRIASVQVKRGSDDANLSRLNIIFEVDGSSVIFKTTSAPAVNEMKTYWINFTKEGILGDPSSVSVAPVYLRNGQEVLGEVAGKVEIPLRSITLSPAELADIFADSGNRVVQTGGDTGNKNTGEEGFIDDESGITVHVIYINSCDTPENTVINQSDTTFRLTGNVESGGTCFTIGYDGVTLDFAGFNITGDDTGEDYGVYNDGYDNVTIKNGEIYDFGGEYPSAGIYLANNQNNNITNMTVNSNYQGIYLYSSSDNNLTNITANLNTDTGVYLYSSSNNNFTDITTNSNTYYGIVLYSSSNNTFTNIIANSNTYGILLYSGSNNNLTDITANSNIYGIWLYSSSDNTLSDIIANSNYYEGIYLYSSSNNNLTNITANSNYYGIYLSDSDDNNLTNITANSNNYGIYLYSSSNNNLTNVYSCRNSNFDFFCRFSDAVGTGNTFKKSKIEFCEDGWPVLNTDYSECS